MNNKIYSDVPFKQELILKALELPNISNEDKISLIEDIKLLEASDLSYLYYDMVLRDVYKTYPVDIETFIHDPYYLGKIYHDSIFNIWENLLKEIHVAPLITRYDEIIVSAAWRSGKSTSSAVSMLYELYKLLCMVDPSGFFLNKSSGRLVFGFISFSEDNIKKYVKDIENALSISPFFKDCVPKDLAMSSINKGGTFITDNIILSAGSDISRLTGGDLYCCTVDEVNIKPRNVAEGNFVEDRVGLWEDILDRKNSTLSKAPSMSGICWLISSPVEEHDVINARINQISKRGTKRVKILDNISRWVARDEVMDDTFEYYLGSETKDPQIIEQGMSRNNFVSGDIIETGIDYIRYRDGVILKVPYTDIKGDEDYYQSFKENSIHAIRNIAGRRTSAECTLFTSVAIFEKIFSKDNDIFTKDEIIIDFTSGKQLSFSDYLYDKDYFKHCNNKECYRYIHIDLAAIKDRFGLASIYSNMVRFKAEDGTETSKRMYFIDLCLGIIARKGSQVDLYRVFQYIHDWKKIGYPIKLLTCDNKEGLLTRQYFKNHGIQAEYLGVGRNKDPYYSLKNMILSESLVGFKNPLLIKELKGLRDYSDMIGKSKGIGNTDDLSDALAGATYSCAKDKNYKYAAEGINQLMDFQKTLNNTNIYSQVYNLDNLKNIGDNGLVQFGDGQIHGFM